MNAVLEGSSAAEAQYLRGRELKARGDLVGAEAAYRAALGLQPQLSEARISLGILLRQVGRHQEAVDCYREALNFDARNYLAHLNLANLLVLAGQTAEAEAQFLAALESNPDSAEAHNNLGHLYIRLERREQAIRRFAEALHINPSYFAALVGLGEALIEEAVFDQAIDMLRKASRLQPDDLHVREQLARALGRAGKHADAVAELEEVLRREPRRVEAIRSLIKSQLFLGQFTKLRNALAVSVRYPDCDDFVRLAYSTLLLRAGEYEEGWRHYDSRRIFQDYADRRLPRPRWCGEDLAEKTLLITREQGLGDEIMFASLFGDIAPGAGHCIVECDQRLEKLYQRSFPKFSFFGTPSRDDTWPTLLEKNSQAAPAFDFWVPLGDLPGRFRNRAQDFPRTPYLVADPQRITAWRERLEKHYGPGPKIGIGWRGGVPSTRATERSLTLDDLRPVLATRGVRFVSVQYGLNGDPTELKNSAGIPIAHWQEAIDDLDEYAALISALDFTVSVCSAVVHLGGALGAPVWVMAPRVPEWRYGHAGESMIWYSSVRMFRQSKAQDWRPVIADITRALRRLTA